MQRFERPEDLPDEMRRDLDVPRGMDPADHRVWWRHASAAYRKLTEERVPILWAPTSVWDEDWSDHDVGETPPTGRQGPGPVGTMGDRAQALALEGGNVLSQTEIAEKWRVSTPTVNKMAIDLERCQAAGIDPFDFS